MCGIFRQWNIYLAKKREHNTETRVIPQKAKKINIEVYGKCFNNSVFLKTLICITK